MRDTAFAVVNPRRLVAHYADAKPEPRRLSDDDHVDFLGNQVAFSPFGFWIRRRFHPAELAWPERRAMS